MKRSSSKKEALPKSEDGIQQKISSFFQPGTKQVQSKLFTGVKKSKPLLSLKRENTASKTNSGASTGTVSADTRKTFSDSKVHMTVLKDYNSVASHSMIPENKTPQKPGLKADPAIEQSPEIVMIPDTPEEKLEKHRPKMNNRSFLCPVSLLSTMPGKKTSPPKLKQKRTVKKPLVSVSVEFGQKRLSVGGDKETGKMETSDCVDSGNATPSTRLTKIGALSSAEETDFTDFSFESSFLCSPVESLPLSDAVPQMETERKVHDSKQAVTPTKSYPDGKMVKRMAQTGVSPDPKRILSAEAISVDDCKEFVDQHSSFCTVKTSFDDSNEQPEQTASHRMVKAKRKLVSLSGFKNVKEMNQSVNNYQLGGNAKSKTKSDVSCAEDDVLADILGQMADVPTKEQTVGECNLHGEAKRSSAVLNIPVQKEKMETESPTCDTKDDDVLDEILGELNDSLNQKHMTNTQKSSRLNILKNNHQSMTSSNKNLASKEKQNLTPEQPVKTSSKQNNLEQSEKHVNSLEMLDPESETVFKEKCLSANRTRSTQSSEQETSFVRSSEQAVNSTSRFTDTQDNSDIKAELKGIMTPDKTSGKCSSDWSADVEEELAGSFGQMSPFKQRHSRQQSQHSQSVVSTKFTDKWNRFVVQSVCYDRQSHAIVLELSREGDLEVTRKAVLQGFWSDTHVEQGDVVHLLPEMGQEMNPKDQGDGGVITIGDDWGHIVVSPDLLLSGTAIVSGVYCLRRSVLNEKFKGVDSKNIHMLYGSIIHSLFQEVLKNRLTKTEEILATAKSTIQSNKFLHEMYGQSATEAQVMEEIQNYVGPLQTWLKTHVPSTNELKTHRCSDISVVQIHDIEETIWSPRLGVKGKIDLTVEVEMQKERGQVKRKVLPLELKTGKASYSVEHKGQVTLYSLMTSERQENPEEGLLLYLKHNDMNTVPVKPENTRGLLQLRNEMAYYLSRQTKKTVEEDGPATYQLGHLPSPINSLRSCSKCPQLTNCAIYQRNVENLQHCADHAMSGLVPDTLSHLSDSHLSYFTHWLLCMDLETSSQRREGLRNIWCMASSEREQKGDCLQQLVMVDSMLGVPETQAFTEGKGCCVQFQRKPGFSGVALNEVGLAKNDSIVISSEDGRYIALSTGFIKHITETVVDVVVDRDSFHENAAFQSLVFRIDRCDSFNMSGYLLTNLSRLMEPSPHCQKLRSLIIDGRKPEFQLKMSKSAVEKVKKIFKPLNKPQKTAVLKVLMSKDFVLIKGYPGTGKTSTIVALVKILRELGQSVLLTSYTHSAVDNILLKLKKDGVPFLRLGRTSRIHPLIQDHAAETLTLDITSVDDLRNFYSSYGIVATSCLGVNHPMFTQRKFDVCIVDEASQVLQPACLGPLFNADRFVLVGDPQQLPPVVQNKEASSLGMGESLFVRLDGAGATYDLNLQYRMNSTIMQLSNELVYDGALQCGADCIALACIPPSLSSVTGRRDWLSQALDTSLTNAVVFFDTCQTSAAEISDGRGLTNPTEVNLIFHLSTTFVEAGITPSDIGVIAPYRAQVRLLQQRLSDCFALRGLEVNTVDQYQGRDKSVIFISFVRSASSSDSVSMGSLLQDVRRLNVAVTRAKHKLVLVGNSSTLSRYEPINKLLRNLRSRQQIFVLPPDCEGLE